MAQVAERLTRDLGSGHDLRVMGSSPASVSAPSLEPASNSPSPSACMRSFFYKRKNRFFFSFNYYQVIYPVFKDV